VKSKKNIVAYVEDVINENSSNFIPVADRIATFDNDGNLWSEQPAYFQLFFAIDRVKALASEHPEGKENNWIQTNKDESFFVYLRLYGPEQNFFDQTFPMNKIKKTK